MNADIEIMKMLNLPLTKESYVALVYPEGVPENEDIVFPPELEGGETYEE
jgi:hypothetical protein